MVIFWLISHPITLLHPLVLQLFLHQLVWHLLQHPLIQIISVLHVYLISILMLMEHVYLVLLNKELKHNSPINVINVVELLQPIFLVKDVLKSFSFNLLIQQIQLHVLLVLGDVLNVNLILIVQNVILVIIRLEILIIQYVNHVLKIVLFVLILMY